jgi:hypothetical protein
VYRRTDGKRVALNGQRDYTFFCEGNEDQLGTGFSIHKRNMSAVTRAEFFGGKMYIILKRLLAY